MVGIKDFLPAHEDGGISRLWKNERVPADLGSWQEVHRIIKAATRLPRRAPYRAARGSMSME
jgi:hypothetical protein